MAARNITLPFSLNFDQNNYQDLVWVAHTPPGAEHIWEADGGWRGGAAKFKTGNGDHPYLSLGSFTNIRKNGTTVTRLHIRALWYFTRKIVTQYAEPEPKLIITNRNSGATTDRTIFWYQRSWDYPNTVALQATGQNNVQASGSNCSDLQRGEFSNEFEPSFTLEDYTDQWVCIEYKVDITPGTNRNGSLVVYVTTQDGRFNQTEVIRPDCGVSNIGDGYWDYIDFIGRMGFGELADDCYYKIDELAIDDQYIGPPAGFGDGDATPPPEDPPAEEDPPPPSEDPTPASDISGLPLIADWEEGNWSEWDGVHEESSGQFIVGQFGAHSGSYCARATHYEGANNDNYADYYFADHYDNHKDGEHAKCEELWLRFYRKIENSTAWEPDNIKVALINLTDPTDPVNPRLRRYQIMVQIDDNGYYRVQHSYIDTWQFFSLPQQSNLNPVPIRQGEWEKVKLYVKLNTTTSPADGIVRLWINDELKLERTDLNLREDSDFGMNKLIISSLTSPDSRSDRVQYDDDWYLGPTDPDLDNSDPSPITPPGTPPGARIEP
jgi:hypothetical protein